MPANIEMRINAKVRRLARLRLWLGGLLLRLAARQLRKAGIALAGEIIVDAPACDADKLLRIKAR